MSSGTALTPARTHHPGPEQPPSPGPARLALVIGVGVLLVCAIALLDLATGPYLSFTVFYLIPVAGCACWGGFTPGLLVAALASVAGHWVEAVEAEGIPVPVRIWNDVVRFGTLTLVGSLVSRVHAGMLRERRLARTDPLTGAANARTFYEAALAESERSRRSERPMTLVYFDLDDFKLLNDRHGHAVGDEALRQLVLTARQQLRSTDVLARLGGDEFAILLPGVGEESAAGVLARVRDAVAQQLSACGWPISMSIGAVTFLRPPAEVDHMVRRVDALMYEAKRAGKARVEHAVVKDEHEPWGPNWPTVERRATARVLCDRSARVSREGEQESEGEFATLRNISVAGVGLHMSRRLPPDTVIVIEPLSPNVRSLLARVVRVDPDETGWMHGCVLAHTLGAKDFGGWVEATGSPESEVFSPESGGSPWFNPPGADSRLQPSDCGLQTPDA